MQRRLREKSMLGETVIMFCALSVATTAAYSTVILLLIVWEMDAAFNHDAYLNHTKLEGQGQYAQIRGRLL